MSASYSDVNVYRTRPRKRALAFFVFLTIVLAVTAVVLSWLGNRTVEENDPDAAALASALIDGDYNDFYAYYAPTLRMRESSTQLIAKAGGWRLNSTCSFSPSSVSARDANAKSKNVAGRLVCPDHIMNASFSFIRSDDNDKWQLLDYTIADDD
jgi:hypothetical protein